MPDKYTLLNPEQFIHDPQQLNLYSYSRNDPVNYIDVNGEFAWFAPLLAAKAIALGVSWLGVQSATHIAVMGAKATDQKTGFGRSAYHHANIAMSPALELNKIPIQITAEFTGPVDFGFDIASSVIGYDFLDMGIDEHGGFFFPQMSTQDRFVTGLLTANAFKYNTLSKLSSLKSASKTLNTFADIYDYTETAYSLGSIANDSLLDTDITTYKFGSNIDWGYHGKH